MVVDSLQVNIFSKDGTSTTTQEGASRIIKWSEWLKRLNDSLVTNVKTVIQKPERLKSSYSLT